MNAKKTAVVLQGLQNELCHPSGILHETVREQLRARNLIENVVAFLRQALALDMKCYVVPISFTPDYRELRAPDGVFGIVKRLGAFKRGTPGVELIDEIKPFLPSLTVLGPKRGMCAFGTTDLDEHLQRDGVDTIVACGLLTNICIESTARTANDLGYRIVVLDDCTACQMAAAQEASEKFVLPLVARVMKSRDFLSEMRDRREPSAALPPGV
jgi:nicotinamidase-related amidase